MKKIASWGLELILAFLFVSSLYYLCFLPNDFTNSSFAIHLVLCFVCASFSRYKFGVLALGASAFFISHLYFFYCPKAVGTSAYFVAPFLFLLLHVFFQKIFKREHIAQAYLESTIIFLMTFPTFLSFLPNDPHFNDVGILLDRSNDFWGRYGFYILLAFLLLCYGVLLLHKRKLSRFRYLGSLLFLWFCSAIFPSGSAVPALASFFFNKKTIRILRILDRPHIKMYLGLAIFNNCLLALGLYSSYQHLLRSFIKH